MMLAWRESVFSKSSIVNDCTSKHVFLWLRRHCTVVAKFVLTSEPYSTTIQLRIAGQTFGEQYCTNYHAINVDNCRLAMRWGPLHSLEWILRHSTDGLISWCTFFEMWNAAYARNRRSRITPRTTLSKVTYIFFVRMSHWRWNSEFLRVIRNTHSGVSC